MDKKTKKKIKIAETAANLYPENRRFKISAVARELEMKTADIFELFPNRRAILEFYYESRLLLLDEMVEKIDGFNQYTLSEKLSTAILSVLDLFQDHREFVLESYRKLVQYSCRPSRFSSELRNRVSSILESDQNISYTARLLFQSAFVNLFMFHFHCIVYFWQEDRSDAHTNTMALVDKWTSLVQELFYNAVIDKSADLIRFLLSVSGFSRWLETFQTSKKTEAT